MSIDQKTNTILIVDDFETNVVILKDILKDEYNILTANNGKKALDIIRAEKVLPKLILLDTKMPGMNGREMFEVMKTNERFRRIPVIFITAEMDSEIELLAAGAADFINKPFTPGIVKLRVGNQIALKNYSDNLEEMVEKKTAEATKTLENALQGLANVIEHRDMESGEHVKRTQLYVDCLTEHLILFGTEYADDLIQMQPEIITKSMALHDVGKIAIPDSILLKPARLEPVEYEVMKTHAVLGKEIIHELGDVNTSTYLKHCEDISYGHHERWDGKGYPRGLKAREIPLTARLAAIADVYDALICARVYKSAMPNDEAIKIITDGRGTQFDPVMADALVEIQDRFLQIAKENQ